METNRTHTHSKGGNRTHNTQQGGKTGLTHTQQGGKNAEKTWFWKSAVQTFFEDVLNKKEGVMCPK